MKTKRTLNIFIVLLAVFLVLSIPISAYAKNKTIRKTTKKITLTEGDEYNLKVKNTKVKWSAKSSSLLSLNKSGKIKALKAGNGKISYKVDGKTKKISVIIKKKASSTPTTVKREETTTQYVWLSATGGCYHSINNCGRMNPSKATRVELSYAVSHGFSRCSKCF